MQEAQEMRVWTLGQKDPLEEGMATHSSVLAWRIPWTEEPGGLQSIVLQRVGHDWSDLACMGSGRNEEVLVKGLKTSSYKFWDLMHSMVIIVNNNVLRSWKLLREYILNVLTTKKK